MKAQLKETVVNGTTFQYIDYGDGRSSVDGLIIPINKEVRERLLDVGGFYRDLLTPLQKDESVIRIVILSVTERAMRQLIGFYFDNGKDDMEISWTHEPNIVKHFESYVERKDVPYEKVNTLNFLLKKDTTNEKYFSILNNYYNPISYNDTGIHIGERIVQYGETITINNVQKVIGKFESLNESSLRKLNVDKIILKVNEKGPGMMNTIGSGELYTAEGKVITSIEEYCSSYCEDVEEEEFLATHNIDRLYDFAMRINKKLNRKKDRTQEEKEAIINEYLIEYEKEVDEDNSPVKELIGLNLLLEFIKEGLAE